MVQIPQSIKDRAAGFMLALGWVALAGAVLQLFTHCAPLQEAAAPIQSAADFRDVVCAIADAPTLDGPEVERIRELCEHESTLRELAAAYARCEPAAGK